MTCEPGGGGCAGLMPDLRQNVVDKKPSTHWRSAMALEPRGTAVQIGLKITP